jgi:hypothetical protein
MSTEREPSEKEIEDKLVTTLLQISTDHNTNTYLRMMAIQSIYPQKNLSMSQGSSLKIFVVS